MRTLRNTWATLWPHEGAGPCSRPLARGIGIDWKRTGRAVRPDPGDTIINWGRAERPDELLNDKAEVWNPWHKVQTAVNKLEAFEALQAAGVRVPEFTTNKEIADGWLASGRTVLARRLLRGSRGRGIVVCRQGGIGVLPTAPLYVKYRKKKEEYRIHIFRDHVLDKQQKLRRRDADPNGNPDGRRIRSWANGWIFAREGVVAPQDVIDQSILAVTGLGLTFGAVDVGWNGKEATVYEVNTAPALEGTTLANYIEAFKGALIERDSQAAAG